MLKSLLMLSALFAGFLVYADENDKLIRINIQRGIRDGKRSNRLYDKAFVPEPLKNANNFLYYGTISMGTPGQDVTCDFDTGSADLWVPAKSCTSTSCTKHKRFDNAASSTFKNGTRKFSITYGDGSSASGYTAYDTINFGGLDITKQGFALVTKESGFEKDPMDCMLGLGYQTCANTGFPTPMDNLKSQGLINNNVFAFWLNRNKNDPNGGELSIGGPNTDHFTGNITYAPVTEQCYWLFKMDSIKASTTTVCKNGCNAIADSGTSWIYGPDDDVKKLNEGIGGTYDSDQGLYSVSCSKVKKLPDIVFTIAGKKFPLKPSAYIYDYGGSTCYITILPGNDFWILGDTFMGAYYTIFDNDKDRVGFAVAK